MERKPAYSSSSFSSSPPAKRFDVFLSFRGEDTRNNFTGHLSLDLRKIGLFNIFKDDYALEKGKDIWPELKNSIKDSQYAVVVLSENYATSSWCLRELAKIVKCAGNESLKIRTIFYHVNPSDVRNVKSMDERKQKGRFWEAMEAHKQNLSYSEKRLEKWRNALVTVANQSGHPIEAHTDEAIFVDEFIAKISSELGATIRTIEGLFGMTSRLKKLDSYVLQSLDTDNVCFLGIHGMGGIGKSTLARAYYKQMSHKFDGCSFLQNVREVCKKNANGLVDLQNQLLSDILKSDFAKIGHVDNGIDMIRSRLRGKKVLIILDDVSKLEQLNGLAGEDEWFGKGSIIIVTTRNENFMSQRYTIYRAEYLNRSEALQLFSWKAFGSVQPHEEYKKLSEEVVEYAGYLPLALTVLGSLLCNKESRIWESALSRLKKCPEKEIVEKLKISFDDLDETDKRIFLDIVCFFNGQDKDNVVPILDSCNFDSEFGISKLIDKSLLSIQRGRKLGMHDLLQEMGKEIVRKESGNELGRQSRIWDADDLHHILENEEGTKEVEAIVTFLDGTVKFNFEALSHMKKLRLLMILGFPPECDGQELKCLSNDLQFLRWNRFPYIEFPPSFQPRKLVQLKVCESKIKQLWNSSTKPLNMLKVIDLSNSANFRKFEDFTVVPNLETLILEGCTKLSEIHPSIKDLNSLILLNLKSCTSLETLPEEINGLASLKILNLYGCSNLRKLPDNLEQLKSLRNLDMRLTGITRLPPSIFGMENLESISCSRQEEMVEAAIMESIISRTVGKYFLLPASFCSLTKLELTDCNLTSEAFPEYFVKLLHLDYLGLNKNPFSDLPPGVKELSRLKYLSLENCECLQCLDSELLPSSLEVVYVNYCTSLSSFLDPLKPCQLQCSAFCLDCTELVKRQDRNITAHASLKRFLENPSNRRLTFEIVLPLDHDPRSDYELLAWFLKQSSTESIIIKLDPKRRNCKLQGFAMVFCFGANSSGNELFCDIRVGCSENWKTTMEAHTISLPGINIRRSDHLFLLYRSRDNLSMECINQLESPSCDKLEFSFYSDKYNPCSCGPCGVRLIYEEDIEDTLNEIAINYCNQSLPQKNLVHSSHSESISGLSKLKQLDLEDNLDQLVERQDRENTTFTSLKQCVQDAPNPECKIEIVIPGNKIPSWFRVQSSGPSTRTKLYPNWCTSEWMGFALSVYFPANSSSNNFSCVISFLGENLEVSKESITEKESSSGYIWLLHLTPDYFPINWLHNSFGNIEFTFHAHALFNGNSSNSCCGPCGVRLVYESDKEKLCQIMNGHCNESEDEQDERPKRVEESTINQRVGGAKNDWAWSLWPH